MSFARFTKKKSKAAAKIPTTNSEIIMSQRRVVITGLGQVSPVGNDVATAWSNLLAGKSGIGRITRFDASDINSQIAGEVRDFDIGQYISGKEARRMDVFIHYLSLIHI